MGSRRTTLFISTILIIGFILRVWGINAGLPAIFHFDEQVLPYNAFYALTHRGHIGLKCVYGNLIPYLLSGIYGVYYIILRIAGLVGSPFDFLALHLKDPTNVYLIGKIFFVVVSTFSVFATYLLGKRLCHNSIGVLAALLLAFSFLSIHQSKFMKGDTLGGLFLILSFYFYAASMEMPRRFPAIISGLFLGLAIAARFTLWVSPFAFIFMCLTNREIRLDKRLKTFYFLIFSAIVVFFLTTPSLIFEYTRFKQQVQIEMAIQSIAWVNPGGKPIWLFYFTNHLAKGIGIPLEIGAILGILYSLYKRENFGIILFLFLFFGVVLNRSANLERFVVPIIPFFALFAAKFAYDIAHKLRTSPLIQRVVMGMLGAGFLFPNLINAMKYNYLISQPDTRHIAKHLIEHTIPAGTKIFNEGYETWEQISIFGPALNKTPEQLREQLRAEIEKGFAGNIQLALLKGKKEPAYELKNIGPIEKPFPEDRDKEIISHINKGDYLVISSWVRGRDVDEPMPCYVSNFLEEEYELIKEINPYPVFRWDYYCYRIDYEALSKVSIFNPKVRGGPSIKIYQKIK